MYICVLCTYVYMRVYIIKYCKNVYVYKLHKVSILNDSFFS